MAGSRDGRDPPADHGAVTAAGQALTTVFREEAGRLTASLVRVLGDFAVAEEVVQDSLLTAWSSLPAAYRREHRLLIAGMKGWKSDSTMSRLAQMRTDEAGVRYLGYVPEDDMPGLVAGARALVYPALYEGFGIPVAQAMAAGCPVITSNISSLPEVAGDAAVLIDARSTSELGLAIRRVCDSPSLREDLRQRGLERAGKFTWERAARESLRYFSDLCG